ncbi:histidine phosphatase family protein [Streptomyces sp. NPDC004752]
MHSASSLHQAVDPTVVVFVRHGETVWNREARFQGQLDPPLSDLGVGQAAALADRLRAEHFDAGYVSDLRRARQTAAAVADRTGVEFAAEPLLREIGMGDWQGLTADQVSKRHSAVWTQWLARPRWDLPPSGEGSEALARRADAILRRLVSRHPGQRVICVSHGGFVQAVLARVLDRMPWGPYPFRLDNASITSLSHAAGVWWIDGVNDLAHLPSAGTGLVPGINMSGNGEPLPH